MTVAQNYQLLNNALAQVLGQGQIQVVDVSSLADAGKLLANFKNGYELFNKAILDVMIRTEIDMELFEIEGIPFLSKTSRFGGFIREIYVGQPEAEENTSWDIGDEHYTPSLPGVQKLPVTVKCYTNRGTHRFKWTIPDMQADSAFHSNEELDAYITGIGVAVENAVRTDIVEISRLVRCKYIGDVATTADTESLVNVLTLYKTDFPDDTDIDEDNCWTNKAFLKYLCEVLARYPKRLAQVGSHYINEKTADSDDYIRQTTSKHLVTELLSDVANKIRFNLEADTFHPDKLGFGKYNEVEFWQGRGDDSLEDFSTINVTVDPGDATATPQIPATTFNQNGVIGVMYDDRAIIQIYDMPYSFAWHNDWDRYTTHGVDANYGFAYKKSYPCVIFIVADEDTP